MLDSKYRDLLQRLAQAKKLQSQVQQHILELEADVFEEQKRRDVFMDIPGQRKVVQARKKKLKRLPIEPLVYVVDHEIALRTRPGMSGVTAVAEAVGVDSAIVRHLRYQSSVTPQKAEMFLEKLGHRFEDVYRD